MRCTEAQKMKKKISEVFSKKLEIRITIISKAKKKSNIVMTSQINTFLCILQHTVYVLAEGI